MRILIIEDEVKVATFLCQALAEEGHIVTTCADGESGLISARQGDAELILLDLMLPIKDGITVCRNLRQEQSEVYILMITALSTVDNRIEGLDAGADDYLVKPFALGELLARVRAISRRDYRKNSQTLVVGDLSINQITRTVVRQDRQVFLSNREYALLEYLVRRAGETVSRSMILEHVWEFNFDCGTNIVDVYINYLRSKIDRAGSLPIIHTIRGKGYQIASPLSQK